MVSNLERPEMSVTPDLLTEHLLDAARRAGADAADAMAIAGQSLAIDVRAGQLEQAERAEGVDIGLRVLVGQRQASVSASDISASTITALAERAVAMAREAPEDPYIGWPPTICLPRIGISPRSTFARTRPSPSQPRCKMQRGRRRQRHRRWLA